MSNETSAISIAEFIDGLNAAAADHLELAAQIQENIALAALADRYLIDDPGAMATMLELYTMGGLDLVRQNLEESGLGESARNLRAARKQLGLK